MWTRGNWWNSREIRDYTPRMSMDPMSRVCPINIIPYYARGVFMSFRSPRHDLKDKKIDIRRIKDLSLYNSK